MKLQNSIQLGLGLIGIGREWGHYKTNIPTEDDVVTFLAFAYNLGIEFFDTAPAYGDSEVRFGKFIRTLSSEQRSKIFVSTKFGEHWNPEQKSSYIDHSYDALCRSFDNSLSHLLQVDVLQIHKTTPDVLKSNDLHRALEYALQQQEGLILGASVSDMESVKMVCESDKFSLIQVPYNLDNKNFENAIDMANQNKKWVLINRPYNMGSILYNVSDSYELKMSAYRIIMEKKFQGYILTGTKSMQHLQENWNVFQSISY